MHQKQHCFQISLAEEKRFVRCFARETLFGGSFLAVEQKNELILVRQAVLSAFSVQTNVSEPVELCKGETWLTMAWPAGY